MVGGILRCGECYAAYGSGGAHYYTDKYLQACVDQAPNLPRKYSFCDNQKMVDAAFVEPLNHWDGRMRLPEEYKMRDENYLIPVFKNGKIIVYGDVK